MYLLWLTGSYLKEAICTEWIVMTSDCCVRPKVIASPLLILTSFRKWVVIVCLHQTKFLPGGLVKAVRILKHQDTFFSHDNQIFINTIALNLIKINLLACAHSPNNS